LYDRKCTACDELFEVTCKISEKSNPYPCPYCDSIQGEWQIGAPAVSMDSSRFMTKKKDAGFKEVLQKIASRNPRTKVCEQV
jgi:putative FmdB family regulatory protein